MQRHPYEWPSLAENWWPNHGRRLTTGATVWVELRADLLRCHCSVILSPLLVNENVTILIIERIQI
jgi:hypothetical protein